METNLSLEKRIAARNREFVCPNDPWMIDRNENASDPVRTEDRID